MKLLKNLKGVLIEEIVREDIYPHDELPDIGDPDTPETEVRSGAVNTSRLIDDIYDQNNLVDKSRSIFKVDELIGTLPREMVTETKRNTVLMILESFGLKTPLLIDDATDRIRVLEVIKSKIISEGSQMISEKQTDIENHKRSIALLEKQISEHKRWVMDSEDIISSEMATITQLMNFLEGE